MNLNNMKIALIGLGYVGLPLAVEFGKVRPVLGFDISESMKTFATLYVSNPRKFKWEYALEDYLKTIQK